MSRSVVLSRPSVKCLVDGGSGENGNARARRNSVSRPALAATRAIDIINYLAAHPTESFTLSDIVKRVGINVASAHAVLLVLTDAGYLVRHSRLRTFSLGPSLVAVGSAALEHHWAIDIARDEFRRLCVELDLEGAVCAPAGDEIVFVARAGEHQPRGIPLHVGHRVPLVPPLGPVYVAWSETATEGWLARAGGSATAEELNGYRRLLESVRTRGYWVALEAEARRGLGEALEQLADVATCPSCPQCDPWADRRART